MHVAFQDLSKTPEMLGSPSAKLFVKNSCVQFKLFMAIFLTVTPSLIWPNCSLAKSVHSPFVLEKVAELFTFID